MGRARPSCGNGIPLSKKRYRRAGAAPLLHPAGERNRPQPVREIQRRGIPAPIWATARWNRVLGGGLVQGSMILLGGEPGIVITISLQLALKAGGIKTLYVSGEESLIK
ncbi:MAG: hypothetical protein ACLR8Y_03800 [Alistipes indistinctus]